MESISRASPNMGKTSQIIATQTRVGSLFPACFLVNLVGITNSMYQQREMFIYSFCYYDVESFVDSLTSSDRLVVESEKKLFLQGVFQICKRAKQICVVTRCNLCLF